MTSIFIVSAENTGLQKFIMGVYPTEKLARARIVELKAECGDYEFDSAWFDEVKVGANGADVELCVCNL